MGDRVSRVDIDPRIPARNHGNTGPKASKKFETYGNLKSGKSSYLKGSALPADPIHKNKQKTLIEMNRFFNIL
jgi:hypothetical protein